MKCEVNDGLFDIDSSLVTLAHELKSPLVLIRQLALFMESESLTSKDLKNISRQLNMTSERALRLVSDLTKASRLEDAMFEMLPTNPRKVCAEVLSSMSGLYRINHKKLKVNYTNKDRLVVANQELLSSIIYNFCDNALHYSSDDMPSSLFVKSSRDRVRIGVRDFGPGLPVEVWRDIKKSGAVFSPQPIQARPGSSGLGLYIVSRFVRAMNGEFGTIRHRDGTTLYVDLRVSNQLSLL
jgi:Signal transduction histidine kinase